jgi:hypothetical protein
MRRSSLALLGFLLLASAHDAQALRLGSETVILPIVGRFTGANSTQWRTDVFLSNPFSPTVTVTLRYYPAGGTVQTRTFDLPPFSTLTLPDIVLNNFGFVSSAGPLEVSAGLITTEARARIYNAGNPAGEFGQSVPGVGLIFLNRQAQLYGLSGINGNRVNAGVTNPNGADVDVNVNVRSRLGASLHSRSVRVPAHGNIQYNDIFLAFGITPQDGVVVDFSTSELPIFGYASEVRNDTGDAIFIVGLSPNS